MTKDFSKTARRQSFLSSIPQNSIKDSDIISRSKFNFSYLVINPPGQDFIEWNGTAGNSKLVKLINSIKDFTRQPLSHWEKQKIGTGKRGGRGRCQSCLEIYKDFPKKSAFIHPPNVPEDVWWGRFRIDNATRLVGFTIPEGMNKDHNYDCNTFYVVFLDENHQFYLT